MKGKSKKGHGEASVMEKKVNKKIVEQQKEEETKDFREENEPYSTIWECIKTKVPEVEREEIKRVLGAELVDKNEDLRMELETLREILMEFQQENERVRDQLRKRPILPDHPARVMLEQQILLLIDSVQKGNSGYAQQVLTPRSKTEREVQDYVMNKYHGNNNEHENVTAADKKMVRPSTSNRRPSTASSLRSSISAASAPADLLLESIHKHLNVYEIEKVTKDIRDAMNEETEDLLQEIEYVQSLLDYEQEEIVHEKHQAMKGPPALEHMREYTAKLEKTWLMEDSMKAVFDGETKQDYTSSSSSRTVKKLRSAVQDGRNLKKKPSTKEKH